MAGIFVQSVAFGSISTAVGLAEDLQKGLLERFRALPMARSAVLTGRTTADLVRNIFVVGVITAVGYAVGFRIGAGVPAFVAGVALILFFAYAMSWGFAVIGLSAPNSETAQVMAFPILFPLVFASPAFVGVNTMPGWLRAFATHQPIGVVITATRALMEGGPTATPVFQALLWCAGLLIVFVPSPSASTAAGPDRAGRPGRRSGSGSGEDGPARGGGHRARPDAERGVGHRARRGGDGSRRRPSG